MWFQWVYTVLPYLDQGPILELGFGTGRLLDELNKRGLDVIGLDRSMYMARLVHSRVYLRKRDLTKISEWKRAEPAIL